MPRAASRQNLSANKLATTALPDPLALAGPRIFAREGGAESIRLGLEAIDSHRGEQTAAKNLYPYVSF
jgi:hypothetical protein